MFIPKATTTKKIKDLAIVFCIFLIGCAGSTRPAKLLSESDGFGDIKWGAEISALKDMEEDEEKKSSGGDLVWYRRKGDTLTMGEAKLKNIFYSFWKGEFESVWIDIEGDENFEALKKELIEQFGKVGESERSMQERGKRIRRERKPTEPGRAGPVYAWWGKSTEVWLSYSKDRHKGALTMNSRKIREERRDYEKEKEREERLKKREF